MSSFLDFEQLLRYVRAIILPYAAGIDANACSADAVMLACKSLLLPAGLGAA